MRTHKVTSDRLTFGDHVEVDVEGGIKGEITDLSTLHGRVNMVTVESSNLDDPDHPYTTPVSELCTPTHPIRIHLTGEEHKHLCELLEIGLDEEDGFESLRPEEVKFGNDLLTSLDDTQSYH